MNADELTPELRALASQSFKHQAAGRFAEAAQGYVAVLSRAPKLWSACYNLGLVYQHLVRLPEAAELYLRTVRINPQFAQAFNNLGNVFKALKREPEAIEAYRRALALNSQLSEASYNLAVMLQARGEHAQANELFRKTVSANPQHVTAWDALYRILLGLKSYDEAIEVFIEWDRATPPSPELVAAGLTLCRLIGDPALEARYLGMALDWPFADFTPEQFVPILGMLQYFDITREQLRACYRRFDAVVAAQNPATVPLLPRRAADTRLRIGYVSADFRRHVMGRWMLEVISRHDRNRISIFLVSTCPPNEFDKVTDQFRACVDGFADISGLDDLAAAKSIVEADLDILVDLAGHTMAARPGVYAHQPARTIVTHLGYHGCLGLRSVDYKLTDRVADRADAAQFQIERPFALDTCLFPFVRIEPADDDPALGRGLDLEGKFVIAAFTNALKLSSRCLAVWRRVLDAVPEAVLLFSPLSESQYPSIERILAAGRIDKSRIAFLQVPVDEAMWRARYRRVDAVLDTFPYAGGDTTLAALDMGVPVVTLVGMRQSERVGASILTHLGVTETIANSEDEFVAIAVKLARDDAFMNETRQRIEAAVNATDVQAYTHTLEDAFAKIAAEKPVPGSMTLTAPMFFNTLREGMRRHSAATEDAEHAAVAALYAELRNEQPDYSPLLHVQGELAQKMGNAELAADCAGALLRQFPDDLDVRLSSAGFLIDGGMPADAFAALPPVNLTSENDVRVLKLYTRAHAKLGQWETALKFSALAIELAPADVQVLFWHGMVLSHTGDAATALTFLNRALILAPHHVEAAYNAGVILAELGSLADAETVFRRALAAPAALATRAVRISAHLHLLHVLSIQGRQAEWISEGERFAKSYPDLGRSRLIESRIERHHGNVEQEARILLPLAEAATLLDDDASALDLISEMLLTLSFQDVPAKLFQRLQTRFVVAARALYPPLDGHPNRNSGMALQVGYLVDFSQPFNADFISILVAFHDSARLNVKVYALSPVSAEGGGALAASGVALIAVATLDERRIAQRIMSDSVDILVDVAAFGPFAKPGVLSCRPARVQVTLPGFTCPSGIGELDFRFSDRVVELNDEPEAGARRPEFLEGCVFPLLPAAQPRLQLTKSQLGVSDSVPVFGVLASADRISARCLTIWKALSDRVPAAVFLVCPLQPTDRETIVRLLSAGGIDASRVLKMPTSLPRPRDLCLTGTVEAILDTMPGSDYFSARAAILDSIPLVTMSGRMPQERVAVSLLTYLGNVSTVADSGRDYVDIASRIAQDRSTAAMRAAYLGELLQKSLMFDMGKYVKHFEDALFRAAATPERAERSS